jgi:hypothetical protein
MASTTPGQSCSDSIVYNRVGIYLDIMASGIEKKLKMTRVLPM